MIQGRNAITTPVLGFAPLRRLSLQSTPPPPLLLMAFRWWCFQTCTQIEADPEKVRPWANISFRLASSGLKLDRDTFICV